MAHVDILLKKLAQHSALDAGDIAVVKKLPFKIRHLADGQDFIRQGQDPNESAIVVEGVIARYHTVASGGRQYLSLHLPGDWPDAQGLFLDRMDHSVCAIGAASLCTITHSSLIRAFRARPTIGFAVWRETLIDAAIFREAITNNGSRSGATRLAHFFCEIFSRAKKSGLVRNSSFVLPLNQTQLGELLGMSIATTNRHIQSLRKTKAADFKSGVLKIDDWRKLTAIGEFDPLYLHQKELG